jgi:all-trans-retinol 13,14-reductase
MNWRDVEQWDGTKVMRRGDDYEEFKRRKAQQCIEFVGKYIQGLEEHVEKVYTSTPLSYKDYTSTHEGSAYGIKKDFSKLMFTMLTPRTPLPNLLLTGQNLNLHGVLGVSMTSFFTCAEILGMDKIKDLLKLR